MDLVTIIVSYNTRELLRACLESTQASLQQSGLAGEVWVVDNASTDGSVEMVRSCFPQVRLIAHDQNLGFAAGNNLALQAMAFGQKAFPRHVLFLNPDTRVQGDAPAAMVRFLDATPRAGVVGAQLIYEDKGFQHSAFAFPGLMQIFLDLFPIHHTLLDSRLNGRYPRSLYEAGEPFAVDHPLGAALMIRGETLSQVGSFDERYFMYCEEIDLCRRVRAAGWEIYCLPEAKIVHLAAQSTRQFRDRMFVALWRSRFHMFERYESRAFVWKARRLVRLGLWAETCRARKAYRQGLIDAHGLEKRLAAFREVSKL